jgi:cytidylate kinase
MAASNISSLKCVRLKMVDMQRKIADKMSCVLDGRDIGSFVLPNADFKFYITASVDVRADRRFKELALKGHNVDFEALKQEIEQRDYNDRTREFAPLRKAIDAVEIDTSFMSVEQVVGKVLSVIGK